MKPKILVTGSNGQLGQSLRQIATHYSKQYQFVFSDITPPATGYDTLTLDITDHKQVVEVINELQPSWVINAAAYTAVDRAESEPDKARLLNATAVATLAQESHRIGAGLVHISTDYIFDGSEPVPLTETMATAPRSVYGTTKLEGEQLAALNPRHFVLRTSWLFSPFGSNFVTTMLRLGSERKSVDVVADQWGSPTSADDLATAVMTAIASADRPKAPKTIYGTYHFSNQGTTCWADFAQQIFDLAGVDCTVNHITTADYPTAAQRPEYSMMSSAKFCKTFRVTIPEWELSLEKPSPNCCKSQFNFLDPDYYSLFFDPAYRFVYL